MVNLILKFDVELKRGAESLKQKAYACGLEFLPIKQDVNMQSILL